ncbi:hypothetical protein [Microlunatus parietis]|uniref:Uncharacterized protein n=1 Tax=Microlunatus parietis TaxID=682979 RepID=A0A7Y9IAR7_9ACTN|nr:hypothetical protein [Microlunatus parietis]NYE73481.1 hypothetical protein [Microlunatus parietis]
MNEGSDQPEVLPLLAKPWPTVDHRSAQAQLRDLGWLRFAQGDQAYAYRSPTGRLVARVSPFELGYDDFVELCRRCAGNPHLPRIDLASGLEGGGHLTVLEYLTPPSPSEANDFLRQWHHPETAGPDLRALRREVDLIDARGRDAHRGWVGIDLGERHVLRSADGNLKVLDLFGVDAVQQLIKDPHGFARSMPADRCRYLLDLPDLQLADHPADYLRRVREAYELAFPPR